MARENIRNFCIIAHIDHGKTTLSDRILEFTGAIDPRRHEELVLDDMPLERERGITIKARAVRLNYKAQDGQEYLLNLIDTPGHVDFTYEVMRSLAACEGAVLLVDATQGVEAQTVANLYLARKQDLVIIPVINKIDLPSANPDRVIEQLMGLGEFLPEEVILASAKEGIGTEEILEAVVNKIPPPEGEEAEALNALIFDSQFDPYKGVVVYVRVFGGRVKKGDKIRMAGSGRVFEVAEVGVFTPEAKVVDELLAGEVGYITANIKDVAEARVGDVIVGERDPVPEDFKGIPSIKPMVFAGLYPTGDTTFEDLRRALERLRLNDAALSFEAENSPSLGFGFRCGFLGLLHMDIVQERLEREYDLDIVTTAPNVVYKVRKRDGEILEIDNPTKMPDQAEIEAIEEPFVRVLMIVPADCVGAVMKLAQGRRGVFKSMDYLDPTMVSLVYEMPLGEIVLDFYDRLKSVTRGYGSCDYEFIGYRESDLVKLDIMLNGEVVDSLSVIVHKDKAYHKGQELVKRLKELIPKHMFQIAIQAAVGKRVIARETKPALRKDVTAKLYGGDVTRKIKLLEKQKKGKKRMKKIGKVSLPQEAFLAVVRLEGEE